MQQTVLYVTSAEARLALVFPLCSNPRSKRENATERSLRCPRSVTVLNSPSTCVQGARASASIFNEPQSAAVGYQGKRVDKRVSIPCTGRRCDSDFERSSVAEGAPSTYHALGSLLVHDTMSALSATDGFSRSDLVGGSAVGANVLHHRVACGQSTDGCTTARCRACRSCLVRHDSTLAPVVSLLCAKMLRRRQVSGE